MFNCIVWSVFTLVAVAALAILIGKAITLMGGRDD